VDILINLEWGEDTCKIYEDHDGGSLNQLVSFFISGNMKVKSNARRVV
jgi:hypothetical protein